MNAKPTPLGLSLRATDTRNGHVLDRTFDRFPLRIGRSVLNALQLDLPFVSNFHAVVERRGEQFFLRDLGSKNPVMVNGQPLTPHQAVDLAAIGHSFDIGPIQFRFTPVPVVRVLIDNHTNVMMASSDSAGGQAWQTMIAEPTLPSGTGRPPRDPAQVALQGLRQLALLYQAGTLDDAEKVLRFLNKIKQTLDLFFAVVIPLREGTRMFQKQLNVRQPLSVSAITEAKSPIQIATAVLHVIDPGVETLRVLEDVFADFVVHQLAMVDATLRGVRALLDDMAPPAIEREVERRGGGGLFGKTKALWKVFAEKHRHLADQDGDAFSVTFGDEFADAYKTFTKSTPRPSIVPQKKTNSAA